MWEIPLYSYLDFQLHGYDVKYTGLHAVLAYKTVSASVECLSSL